MGIGDGAGLGANAGFASTWAIVTVGLFFFNHSEMMSRLILQCSPIDKGSLEALGLRAEDVIVIDCGHCSGRFCFSCSAMGCESIGFGTLLPVYFKVVRVHCSLLFQK
jgi:hypothetical protein